MKRKTLLFAGAIVLFILSFLDRYAFRHYLYWKYDWFDLVMHFFGGLSIGLISSFFYLSQKTVENTDQKPKYRILVIFNLVCALVIGTVWEIFELAVDRIVVFKGVDVSTDILMGLLGTLIGGLIFWISVYGVKNTN